MSTAGDTPALEMPPRPEVSPATRALVERWWKYTASMPDFDVAVSAQRESQKALFPAWFDPTDPFKGLTPKEMRRRKDDRRVNLNLIYKNIQQVVAMTVPDDHEVKFPVRAGVGGDATPPDPITIAFSETMETLVRDACHEVNFQSALEAFTQEACQYRLAIMKIVYERDFSTDPIRAQVGEDRDQQSQFNLLQNLMTDFARRVFDKDSPEFARMVSLQEALQVGSELRLWHGLRVENVPLDCVRFDPTIRDFNDIYRAKWMRHDTLMSLEDIKVKFPWKQNDDGTFSGIHPDDLKEEQRGQIRDGLTDQYWNKSRQMGKGPTNRTESKQETDRILVCEIWSRTDNRVYVLVENIPYPAASWVPERTPSQWYPFRFFQWSRVTGQVYGVSDAELQAPCQHRINRKRTDEEGWREIAKPRGVYNTQGIDQNEVNKLKNLPPGELTGLNLGGSKLSEVVEWFTFPPAQDMFNTLQDEQDMRQMAGLPEQINGVTGNATSATEVNAAMQGASIASSHRMALMRRFLEGTYTMIAEILLQELDPDEAKMIAGPLCIFPEVHSEKEAVGIMHQLRAQAEAQINAQLMAQQAMAQQSMMMGVPPPLPPAPPEREAQIAQIVQDECMRIFGFPEPLTREAIFRRLRCEVQVSVNAQADRQQRINAVAMAFSAIQSGAQAAAASGMMFDPRPLLRMFGPTVGTDLTRMFKPMPMMPMAPGPGGAMPPGGGAPGATPGNMPGAPAQEGSGGDSSPVGSANPNTGGAPSGQEAGSGTPPT